MTTMKQDFSELKAYSAKQQMILDSDAQMTIIGGAAGSGKSYLLQMMPLMIADDPNTACIMFRRTTPQLNGQGGLVDKARKIYNQLPLQYKPTFTQNPWTAKFPNGCNVVWRPMQHVDDKEDIQGLEFTLIGVDEACQFEWEQLDYMTSRLRSESKYRSRIVMSCNPDPDHMICELIKDFYLDDDGYPIPEKDGVVRYYVKIDGDITWGDTQEELMEIFDIAPEDAEARIVSFTFISATIYDNPVMLQNNRAYLANLEALDPVEKARLLHGCWFARPKGSGYFKRDWLRGENGVKVKRVEDIPKGCNSVRGIDCAHTEPSEGVDPDYTAASPLILKDKEGQYWVTGFHHEGLIDIKHKKSDKPVVGRVRKLAGERNNLLAVQAQKDMVTAELYGLSKPKIAAAKDSGGAASDYLSLLARLTEVGASVHEDKMPSNVKGKKVKDFLGFSEAAQLGQVFIVEDTFEKGTLEAWYKELEQFDGTPSTRTRKDD